MDDLQLPHKELQYCGLLVNEALTAGEETSFGLAMMRGITSNPGWEMIIDGSNGTTISARFPRQSGESAQDA